MATNMPPDSLPSEQPPPPPEERGAEKQDCDREVWHLKFRAFSPSESSDPIEDLRRISELCYQWLRPDLSSKEEILDQLVLEQFMISMPPELQAFVKESRVQSCKELEKMLRGGRKPRHWKEEVWLDTVPESKEQDYLRHQQSRESDSVQDRDEASLLIPQDPQLTQVPDSVRGKDVMMPQEDTNMAAVTPFTHGLERRDLAAHTDLQSLCGSNGDHVPTCQGEASCMDKTEDGQLGLATLQGPVEPVKPLASKARFVCSECKKSFFYRSQFIIHQRSHTGERPFKCSVCNKGFLQSSDLRIHQRIHTGEKPYMCSICSRGFAHKSTLLSHTRVHTKEKPHECELCGKCFSHKGNFNAHLRIHSDSRPYRCKECDLAFRHQGTLKQHVKIHSRMASL